MNILRSIKHFFSNVYEMFFFRKKLPVDSLDNTFLIMLAADYNNLGDVAITYAQKEYLYSRFPNFNVLEIPVADTCKVYFDIKRKITKNTIITIIGGGNTGDKYELLERLRRFIIRRFSCYKVIGFPQTIDFSNTKYGNYSLKRSIKDYSKNKNFIICAREKTSETLFKKYFNNKIYLIPDIVLSLSFDINNYRSGTISMFRNDKEKLINDSFSSEIIDFLSTKSNDHLIMDTSINNFDAIMKYDQFKNLLKEISKRKLAITDRLHGMIFCYITGTPCIVFSNNNHKITQTYKNWLSSCNYIILEESVDLNIIKKDINKLYKINKIEKNNVTIENKFEELYGLISHMIDEEE